ncbi:MAG: Phenylalanine--tRNA ligase alpha subunit [Bacteroidetes bacterium ADurb.Bin397]|jgi:phenylalanyl-tRNA synthetase alpha chain|nr:MAG: Phenylalanine--tRNA ligase alpha subunit [Bacteroidetes bacterium ADurb.Bin397]
MFQKIEELILEVENFKVESREELESFRIQYLSKKSPLTELFAAMKTIAPEERKNFGLKVNELKNKAEEKFRALAENFGEVAKDNGPLLDPTLPAEPLTIGSRHPVSIIRNHIIEIFNRIGYAVAEGPEIEDDWHNFTALNFPPEHPARDMQDTFFMDDEWGMALRTHTSSVQVRVMQNSKPPIRIIAPGRVYRNEAISARAHCLFHQVEGLYIDENVSFADLKQTLMYFAQEMFGSETKIRLRPSYFPFTEPSAEMDVSCNICNGKGCNVCKYTGWLEIMGCGMVDPNVLDNCGIDSKKYSGFAFGMGIERIAMLKYTISDLRLYFENDMRFLEQFK